MSTPPKRSASPARPNKQKPRVNRRVTAPEAYEDYDEVSAETVKSIQERADKILKKQKWVAVDGYVDKS